MQSSVDDVWEFLEARFGVDRDSVSYEFREVAGAYWIVTSGDVSWEMETQGIRAIREMDGSLKPTTYLLQLLEDELSKNVVDVDRDDLVRMLDKELVDWEHESEGFVALRYAGRVVGCGLYKNASLSSWVPKGRGEELQRYL